MKKFFLFAAALITAVSMNVRAAEVPDNVRVRELLLEMIKLQKDPMPAVYAEELDATLAAVAKAQTLDTPDWTAIYQQLKDTYDKCQKGIEFYAIVDAAIETGETELKVASPNAKGREELQAAVNEAKKGYEARTLLPDDPKAVEMVLTLVTPLELDKISLNRKVVGTELRGMKATGSNLGVTLEQTEGTGATYKTATTANCYVSGVRMTSIPGYYTPGKYEKLDEAITNNVWIGAKMTVAKDAKLLIDTIKVHLASSADGYIWDAYIFNADGEELYSSQKAYKISNCAKATHTNDEVMIADSAAFAEMGALPAGDYEVRIYLYGKKNNDIVLKELSIYGLVVNGTPYIAPVVNMPDSLTQFVSVASTNLSKAMYYQAKANLAEAIEYAQTTTDYAANYAYLEQTNKAAVTSIADYETLADELIIAQGILEAGEGKTGYDTYKNAFNAAQAVYDNGTAETVESTVKTLIIAEKAFYAAEASEKNPVDVTAFIKNYDFSLPIDKEDNWDVQCDTTKVAWDLSEDSEGFEGAYIRATSSKKFKGYTITQTLVNIPNGDYKFTAKTLGLEGTDYNKGTLKLLANGKNVTCTRKAEAAESSVYVRVTDNTLALTFTETDDRNEAVGFGNVKLEYYNFRSWANVKEEETAYTVSINSQESLDDAFLKTDWAEGKDVNFVLSNPDVEYYNLGTGDKNFPTNHGNFTFISAAGATPKVAGCLKPNVLSVKNFTIGGITFIANKAAGTYQNAEASPIYINKNKKDSICGELLFTNCRFENLPGAIARIKGDGNGNYIHAMTVEYCYVDSMYQNLMQFAGGDGWGMSNFTFRENIVTFKYQKDQGQVFNTAISAKHPANDTVFTMNIEHNTFYKMSGNQSADKLFLECNKTSDWKEIYINISNNIFYDRYSWDGGMHCGIALFDLTAGQKGEVSIMNNVLFPENVMRGGYADDFHVTSGNIPVVKSGNIVADSSWNYTPSMLMLQTHPYFTAGVKGTYIGPRSNYYDFNMDGTDYIVENTAGFKQALEYFCNVDNNKDLTVYFKDNTDECGYYDLGYNAATGKFPQKYGDITFKPYEGAKPEIAGSFRSSNGMKVNTYTVEGLYFKAGSTTGTEASPIYIQKGVKDSIKNEIIVRNCTFTNMPACMIRINANGNENFVNSILFENNTIDGIGHHLFQFAAKNTGLSNFTFRENVVKNMYATGGQFFNTPVSTNAVAGSDSIYTMTVDHNTFYKIGGKASADRNFLESNANNTWKEVYINFTNNIFYDRYDWAGKAESDLKLFNKAENQIVEVNFSKNALMPKNVMANADVEKYQNISFPVIAGNITPTYDHVTLIDTSAHFWANEAKLKLWSDHPYYTMGVNGTYIGAKCTYIAIPEIPENAKYWWEATNEEHLLYEVGGKAAGLNPDGSNSGRVEYPQCGYSTISLNGKKFADDQPYIKVKTSEALAAGDTLVIAAFRSKGDATKKSNAYFAFGTVKISDGTDGLFYNDIVVAPQDTYTTHKFTLPEEANGIKEFRISRDQTGTNLFIVKLGIIPGTTKSNAPIVDGIEEVKSLNAIFAVDGVLYINLNEATMVNVYDMTGRAMKSVNAVEGLNEIEGLNEGQIYIVRAGNTTVKIAL